MSVTIILQQPNAVTIAQQGAATATVQQTGAVSATIIQTAANEVTVNNITPNAVTVSNGLSGGGTWGSITGTITDQTDLVTYVNRAVPQFLMTSQDGTEFTIVVTNAGELLVIPEGSSAPTIVGIPTISGTEAVWYTLLAVPAAVTGSPTPTRAWQWQRSTNGTDWVDITGATSISYLLVDLDGNNYIRVKQTERSEERRVGKECRSR